MSNVRMIGIDLAKNGFQVHGCDQARSVVVRKTLLREGVISFFHTTCM